jgi:hypothetical protein
MKAATKAKTTTEDDTSGASATTEAESTWSVDQEATTTSGDSTEPSSKESKGGATRDTVHIREIRAAEDSSLRDFLDGLGTEGSFRVAVHRVTPEEWDDPKTGARVQTKGLLRNYDRAIDEEFISKTHGGGKYVLRILRKNDKGSFKFFAQRTIEVAGDPRVDDVPRTRPQPIATAAAPGESPSLVKEAFAVMREQVDRANERPEPKDKTLDPAVQMLLERQREDMREQREQFREEMRRRDEENAQLRRDIAEMRDRKPAEDTFKDKLLGTMMDSETARMSALRQTHESELRQVRQYAMDEQARRDERNERDMAQLRASYERELATLKSANETTLAIAKQSHDTQVKLLEHTIRQQERDLDAMRKEVGDLRAKKDKSVLEQMKEFRDLKDALSDDEDGAEKTGVDKVIDIISSPAAAELVGRVVGAPGAQVPQQQVVAAPQQAQVRQRQLVRDPRTGNKYLAVADSAGNTRLIPAKKKPKMIPPTHNPDGSVATPAIQLPEVDPASVAIVVGYLERAYAGNQDPEIVAQSQRASVPDQILTWIRDHDTEQVSGVDLFMKEVAKLPSTSPLATQAGRNWLRRVGKALVGD